MANKKTVAESVRRVMRAPAEKPSEKPKADLSGVPVPAPVTPPAPTAPAPARPVRGPDPIPQPPPLPTPEEISEAEKELEAAKAKLWALLNPVIPYPKWVEGIVVDSPEEEAAVLGSTAKTKVIKQAEGDRTVIVKGK